MFLKFSPILGTVFIFNLVSSVLTAGDFGFIPGPSIQPPTGLFATATTNSVTLNWTMPTDGKTCTVFKYKNNNSYASFLANVVGTQYTETNLTLGSVNTYYLTCSTANGTTSAASAKISVTTAVPVVVAKPPQPYFDNLVWNGNNIIASFRSAGGTTQGILVAYNEGTTPPTCSLNSPNSINVGNVTSYKLPLFNLSTSYTIRVCAYNSAYDISSGSTRTVSLPEYSRVGTLESETLGASLYDEFSSNEVNPVYTFGESDLGKVRKWIGTMASSPNVSAKQTFKLKSLLPGQLYSLRLYGAYASVANTNWMAQVVEGSARILYSDNNNRKTFAFPLGDEAVGTAWTLLFVPSSNQVSFEFSGMAATGNNFIYIDAWEFISHVAPVPAGLFTFTSNSGPKFLGEAKANTTRYSPKWRIVYNDRQFNTPADLAIRQYRISSVNMAIKFLYTLSIPEYNYDIFTTVTIQEILGRDQIGKWIDMSFDEIRGKWARCGGKYANYANSFSASKINVNIMPAAFYTSAGNYRGLVSGQSTWPSGKVTSTALSVSYLQSNPRNAMIYQTIQAITAWEIGNILGMSSRYFPGTTLSSEIGSKSPCGL